MNERITEEYLNSFEAHDNWLNAVLLKSKKTSLSRSMVVNYNSVLRQLIQFSRQIGIAQDPDQLLDWANSLSDKDEQDEIIKFLNDFATWLQGKEVRGFKRKASRYMREDTAWKKAHGVARGFFTRQRVWLPSVGQKFGNGRSPTKKNDIHYSVFKVDEDADIVVKDYSQFRLFLGNLIFRDQVIAMCMGSSGLDPSDILKLKVGDIMKQGARSRIFLEGRRTKTKEEYRTFFSTEATEYLRQYIAQERTDAELTEKLFEKRGDEPMTAKALAWNFWAAAEKLGVTNGDTQNPYRPKRMRSIFSSACYQAKVDDGARHIFMGHASSISEKYRELPAQQLELIYKTVEPYVTVFSGDKGLELKKLEDRANETNGLVVRLIKENADLREKLAELSGSFEALAARVEEFEDLAEIGALRKEAERLKEEARR